MLDFSDRRIYSFLNFLLQGMHKFCEHVKYPDI